MNDPRNQFVSEPPLDVGDPLIAVLGCGSVGGFAACCLASAGIRRFDLADRDQLAPENLRRHVCGKADIDRTKVEAVADHLIARFAHVCTRTHNFCFLNEPGRLRAIIARADALVVAVDHEAPKYLIDAMARELGRVAVFAGVYGGGWGAEVILADPAAPTPCYACAARSLGRVGVETTLPEPNPFYSLPSETIDRDVWPQADLTSIVPAAGLAARLVVAWLAARHGRPNDLHEFAQDGLSAWRFALRRVATWQLGPWSLEPVPVTRDPNCPVCGRANKLEIPPRFRSLFKEDHA